MPDVTPPAPRKDPFSDVRWMDADDPQNPFGVRVLNCLSTAMGLISTTQNPQIAQRYNALRQSDGRHHVGQLPDDVLPVDCALSYPMSEPMVDGVVHRAAAMEDKWDIYLYDGRLYFARSWTGDLTACADVRFGEREALVSRVYVARADAEADATYAVRQVDFLIKSHVYGWRVPHPLPDGFPPDPAQIAIYSFSVYGRHGFAATYADTIPLRPEDDRAA